MQILAWYTHPWRLFTLFIGMSTLLYGADIEGAPDWDNNVSYIMGLGAYAVMPWFHNRLMRGPSGWVVAFLIGNFVVNDTYTLYWGWKNPKALEMIMFNYTASWTIFLLCWGVWSVVPILLEPRQHTTA
jgi:hypothetical protein